MKLQDTFLGMEKLKILKINHKRRIPILTSRILHAIPLQGVLLGTSLMSYLKNFFSSGAF